MIHPVVLPVNNRDFVFYCEEDEDLRRYYQEIVVKEEYRRVMERFGDRTDLIVVDVGACLGIFTAWISGHCEAVHCIEPCEQNILCASCTIFTNDIPARTYQFAIAGESGRRILVSEGDCGSNTIMREAEGSPGSFVDALTLADFMQIAGIDRIDVLKIDVESAELEIFGAEDFAEVAERIGCIIGERHHSDEECQEFVNSLKACGFDVQFFDSPAGSRLFEAGRNIL